MKELIEALEAMPSEAEVIAASDHESFPVREVILNDGDTKQVLLVN